MTVCTRFAPSPTGDLHLGSARTALYCWLFARHHQGKYILRIEDTDRERSTDEAVQVILGGLAWLGLTTDEGPYYQTQRMARYQEVIQQLLDNDLAYRCYCSKARLQQLREQQTEQKIKPRYDGHCRHHGATDPQAPHVIRFKNPESGSVIINDQVLGQVEIQNSELDDLILARTDGTPTYNLTVVVDDVDMGITHVIRGNDHLNNTPRQINLLKALGVEPPLYAHIPMILGDDKKKLSKRHGAVSVLAYRDMGILPQALNNYLVRLGWSHGDQELFTLDEMIEKFDLPGLNKSPSAFDLEKLLWVNQHYIKTLPVDDILPELQWHFEQLAVDTSQGPALEDVLQCYRERAKTLREMAEQTQCFYQEVLDYNQEAVKKFYSPQLKEPLEALTAVLAEMPDWQAESINAALKLCMAEYQLKMPQLAQPLRIAITGNTLSPSIAATLAILPQQQVVARLTQAIALFT